MKAAPTIAPRLILLVAAVFTSTLSSSAAAQERPASTGILVEPYIGVLRWAEADLEDEILAGLSAGLVLPYGITVVGFYSESAERFGRTGALRAYGGELGAQMFRGALLSSFLQAGLGRLDTRDGSPDAVDDQDLVILGGGLGVRVSRSLRLTLGLRDYVTNVQFTDLGGTRAGDLAHNLLGTAGLQFSTPLRQPRTDPVVVTPPGYVAPSSRQAPPSADTPAAGQDHRSDTLVTIPVPREGELYVRYGPAGATGPVMPGVAGELDAEAVRRLVREELTAVLGWRAAAPPQEAPQVGALTPAQLEALEVRIADRVTTAVADRVTNAIADRLEQRLAARLEELVARYVREEGEVIRRSLGDQLRGDLEEMAAGPPGRGAPAPPAPEPAAVRRPRFAMEAITPFVGLSVQPTQALMGGRVDLGPLVPSIPPLHLTPEMTAGLGEDGLSLLTAAHLTYTLGNVRLRGSRFHPHVGVGLGILFGGSGTEGVLTLAYGTQLEISPRSRLSIGPDTRLFVEHQGLDLYRQHRILIGLRRAW